MNYEFYNKQIPETVELYAGHWFISCNEWKNQSALDMGFATEMNENIHIEWVSVGTLQWMGICSS